MEDQEVYNAWAGRERLQVSSGDIWLNCIVKDIQMGLTGIEQIELSILSPQGWPTDIPTQYLSQRNFHRLRRKGDDRRNQY